MLKDRDTRRQLFGFLIAGACAFCIDAGLLQVLVSFGGVSPFLARVFSFSAAVFFTWQFNRRVSFKVEKSASFGEFAAYVMSQSLGIAVNAGLYALIIWAVDWTKTWPSVALVPATAVSMVVNFVAMKFWIFKKKSI